MKRESLTLFFAAVFLISFVFAQVPEYKDKYVNDYAGILNLTQVSELRQLFSYVEQNNTSEISFLSAETCSPLEPSQFAQEVFDSWKIGKKDKDNGLLILYCKEENKIFVLTGYGLEGILPDSKIGRLLDENYVPERDKGNVALGIVLFSREASKQIVNENFSSNPKNYSFILGFIAVVLFALFVIFIIKKFGKSEIKEEVSPKNRDRIPELKSKDTFFSSISSILFFAAFAVFGFTESFFIALALFILALLIPILFGNKCPKCNQRLKSYGRDGKYNLYRCKNGHFWKLLVAAGVAGGIGHGFSGGGFGGGGFGGGSSGGGGAGR